MLAVPAVVAVGARLKFAVVDTPLRATVAGENTQLYPATETGAPVAQASETDPENPAPGVTVTVALAELPAANAIGLGDTLRLKAFVCACAVRLAIEKSSMVNKKKRL